MSSSEIASTPESPSNDTLHEVRYQLTREDLIKASMLIHTTSPYIRQHYRKLRFTILLVGLICISIAYLASGRIVSATSIWFSFPMLFIVILVILFNNKKTRYRQIESYIDGMKNDIALSPTSIQLSETGLVLTNAYVCNQMKWLAVSHIQQNSNYILVYLNRLAAEIVPKRCFESPEQAKAFYEFARQHCSEMGECPKCHYDQRGNTTGHCPECGESTRLDG